MRLSVLQFRGWHSQSPTDLIISWVMIMFLYHCSNRCCDGLLIPISRQFRTKQKPPRIPRASRPLRPVSCFSIANMSNTDENFHATSSGSNNNDNNSNSLLLDDLLNNVLQNQDHTAVISTQAALKSKPNLQLLRPKNATTHNDHHGWRCIDWDNTIATSSRTPTTTPPPPSPVDIVMIRDRLVYIKRDDQVR